MPCRIKAGNSNDTGVEKVNTNIVTMSEKKRKNNRKMYFIKDIKKQWNGKQISRTSGTNIILK